MDEIRKNSSLSRRQIDLRACSFGGNAFSHIVHRLSSLYAPEGRGLWELHCGFCASCDMGGTAQVANLGQAPVQRPSHVRDASNASSPQSTTIACASRAHNRQLVVSFKHTSEAIS